MKRRRLPIGIQTFAKIREEDHYYVDKTPHILRLIEDGSYYFLARPRRFGKSLLLDTMQELFQSNEPLFRGLYIHDKWNWEEKFPVIRISFADGVVHDSHGLDVRIRDILRINFESLGLEMVSGLDVPGCFGELIRRATRHYGQRTVVLVDEYDKPILDNITNPENAREIRDGLRDLYSVIKGQDAYIQFAFLTGVSKFSKGSLFSGLNNLRDITLSAGYATICGYTEADVDTVFAPELPGLERNEIRRWYNGYHWLGDGVYNPFDLLLLFQEREFRPYWFETGSPTFLIDLLLQRRFFTPNLARLRTSVDLLGGFDIDAIETEALLFQAGYLTIMEYHDIPGMQQVVLGYPNLEVRTSLNRSLGRALVHDRQACNSLSVRLYNLLLTNDFAALRELFQAFFSSIPADWYRNNTIANYEGYYASVFYSYFAGLGIDVIPEDANEKGRIDMSVLFNDQVYIFEFKVVEDSPEGRALAQIKARDYAAKYRGCGQSIHLIGVEFSRQSRNIVGFEVEADNAPH